MVQKYLLSVPGPHNWPFTGVSRYNQLQVGKKDKRLPRGEEEIIIGLICTV